MKKNRMMRAASALLVAVLLTTCTISGTFAKYVTEATGTDSARVAKWDIKLEGAKMTNNFEFDLLKTVYDTKDGNVEQDIAVNDGTIIAPGTQGSFEINLKNDSEVNATYSIDFAVTNGSNIPVEFKVNGGAWKAWSDMDTLDVVDATINMGDAPNITVEWRWVYETGGGAGDSFDTGLGEAAVGADIVLKVDAKITVTQVD